MKFSHLLLLSTSAMAIGATHADELEQRLLRCSVLGDASARLGCFDALAKATEPAPAGSLASGAAPAGPVPAAATAPEQAGAARAAPEAPISHMVQEWELDGPSKRGRYAFRPLNDNYLLAANYSSATNDNPFRSFTPAGIKSKHVELTYQLSFKVKLLEGIGHSPVDLWAGYTQQSFWQAYNRSASSPFRETNYQPELMAVLPTRLALGGVQLRYGALGLVHQSNGQSGSLSRSWNRVYGELGLEHGNFGITARLWKRLDNAKTDNDNPDITDFMGHGDVRASYRDDGHEYSMTLRHNNATHKGAFKAGWAFPVSTNLKGYLQVFTGYGQSLIDYNYSQKSIGAGVLLDL